MRNLGGLIGKGATAEVFAYGQDKVVKLYSAGFSSESVEWEFHKTGAAYESHLPAPEVYNIIELDGRYGIVMEHIAGDSLNTVINRYSEKYIEEDIPLEIFARQILEYIRFTARCLYDIHQMKSDKLETMDERMKRNVEWNRFLSAEEKSRVIDIIESLPKGDFVCHGDPNLNNILISGDRYTFIDWVDSGTGNPMYDIAEYVLLLTPSLHQLPKNTHPKLAAFFDRYQDQILPAFFDEYEKKSGLNISDYEDWFVPLLVSKLNSNRAMEEKNKILGEAQKRLNT